MGRATAAADQRSFPRHCRPRSLSQPPGRARQCHPSTCLELAARRPCPARGVPLSAGGASFKVQNAACSRPLSHCLERRAGDPHQQPLSPMSAKSGNDTSTESGINPVPPRVRGAEAGAGGPARPLPSVRSGGARGGCGEGARGAPGARCRGTCLGSGPEFGQQGHVNPVKAPAWVRACGWKIALSGGGWGGGRERWQGPGRGHRDGPGSPEGKRRKGEGRILAGAPPAEPQGQRCRVASAAFDL